VDGDGAFTKIFLVVSETAIVKIGSVSPTEITLMK